MSEDVNQIDQYCLIIKYIQYDILINNIISIIRAACVDSSKIWKYVRLIIFKPNKFRWIGNFVPYTDVGY